MIASHSAAVDGPIFSASRQQARRRPEGVAAMRARHVLGDRGVPVLDARARVAGDAVAAMEHLDGGLGDPHLDDLADHAGRHGVEVPLDLDVVIRRHAGTPPFGVLVGLGRQRHQGGPVDGVEELAPAGAELAHQAGVELVDQLRMAALSSASEKKRRLRSRAKIQRSTMSTATSTLALSRGLRGRAGMMVVP